MMNVRNTLLLAAIFSAACADIVPSAESFGTGAVDSGEADADTAGDSGDVASADTADAADTADTADTPGPECTTKADCENKGGALKPCESWACKNQKCQAEPAADGANCDDNDPCTQLDTCSKGACKAGTVFLCAEKPCQAAACVANKGKPDCSYTPVKDGATCVDDDLCKTGDQCAAGACVAGTIVKCDDGNACTDDVCAPTDATCTHKKLSGAGIKCADSDPCTVGDFCDAGACASGTDQCKCKKDADCKAIDDENACNGASFCDKSLEPWDCAANPGTVPFCNPLLDTSCRTNVCVATTGECALVHPNQASTKCDPKNQKVCWKQQDVSKPTPTIACDDGDSCTTSICDETGSCLTDASICSCQKTADCAEKDNLDNNVCNGTLYCKLGVGCVVNPATLVTCPESDGNGCLKSECVKLSGACTLTNIAENSACDDDNACTEGDVCQSGACKSGVDKCACKQDADCLVKGKDEPCAGTLYCDVAAKQCKPNPATKPFCSQYNDTACRKNRCDAKTGKCAWHNVAISTYCGDDDNKCTAQDKCDGKGACQPSDGICTCSLDADCANAADKCVGTSYCDAAVTPHVCKVKLGTVVTCDTSLDDQCTKTVCDKQSGKCGKKFAGVTQICDDGNACTVSEYCKNGKCDHGTDVCKCKVASDCFDDGNLCNGVPYCDKADGGTCKVNPASAVVCDGTNDDGCAKNICNPKNGTCSIGDDGSCTANNTNDCFLAYCDLKTGKCSGVNAPDGTVCAAGKCTTGKCSP